MNRNTILIVAITIIINALLLTVMLISFWYNIVHLNILGTMIVLLFIVNAFITTWILDLIKPILESLGNIFGGLGGLLGR